MRSTALRLLLGLVVLPVLAQASAAASPDRMLRDAVRQGGAAAVKAALAKGANPNAAWSGRTAAQRAAMAGNIEVLRALLDGGADVNGGAGAAPLVVAASAGKGEAVAVLLAFGADAGTRGPADATALHWAVLHRDTKALGALLQAGAAADAPMKGGVTPLMLAAVKGDLESAAALLSSGASPEAADARGRTALAHAEAQGHAALASLIKAAVKSAGKPADVPAVDAATDLTGVVAQAEDRQTIVLGAGEFSGVVAVEGKTLTLIGQGSDKTTLKGGKSNVVVLVRNGGTLVLRDVTIRPGGEAQHGIFVEGGGVTLRRVVVDKAPECGVYVNKGSVGMTGCRIAGAGKHGVIAFESSASVQDSQFDSCPQSGIVVEKATSLSVLGCRFRQTPVGVYASGGSGQVTVRNNEYSMEQADGQPRPAMVLQVDGPIVAANNCFIGAGRAIDVECHGAGPVCLVRNVVMNGDVALAINARQESGRTPVYAAGNVLCNPSGAGILLSRTERAVLVHNVVVSGDGAGVALMDKASAAIHGCSLACPGGSLGFKDADPAGSAVCHTWLTGPVWPLDKSEGLVLDEPTRRFRQAMKAGGIEEKIDAAAERVAEEAARAGPGKGEAVAKAVDDLMQELRRAERRAAELATLQVSVRDRVGTVRPIEFVLYEATGPRPGHVLLTAADLKDAAALAARLREGKDPVSKFVAESLPPEAQALIAADGPSLAAAETRGKLAASLSALLARQDFYDAERFAGVAVSPEAKDLIGVKEKTPDEWLRLNRWLLEDACGGLVASTRPLDAPRAPDGAAVLSVGRYWMVPELPHLEPRLVSLRKSGPTQVTLKAGDSQWLTFEDSLARLSGDKSAPSVLRHVLVRLKDRGAMRRALASLRAGHRGYVAMPRFDVAPEERQKALDLVREQLDTLAPPQREGDVSNDELIRRWQVYRRGREAAARILCALGTEADVQQLVAHCSEERRKAARGFWTCTMAYIERRLGTLETGRCAGLLDGGDADWSLEAARYLYAYGSRSGERKLAEAFGQRAVELDHDDLEAVLGLAEPEVLAGMRAVFAKRAAEVAETRWPAMTLLKTAAVYLLCHGNKEDWRQVSGVAFEAWMAEAFMPLAADPMPLVELVAEANPSAVAGVLPLLRDFSRRRALRYAERFEDAVYEATWRREQAKGNRGAAETAADTLRRHEVMSSYFRPNRRTANYFFLSKVWLYETPWVPARAADPKIVEKFVNHQSPWDYDRQLDYFPHEDLVREFEAQAAREKTPHADLILAAHRVTTRAFMNLEYQDRFADGLERRTYCFQEPGDMGGAVCGVMEVRPRLVGRTLQVRLRLHHAGYYHATNFISANEPLSNFRIHPYMIDGGRALVGEVRARVGGKAIPAAFSSVQPDGSLLYEAELPQADLAGVYLEVEARFVKQSHAIVFDLFAGECNRRRTRLAAVAAEKDVAAAAAAAKPEAWIEAGYAHQAMGEVDEAMKRFRKAIDLAPRRDEAYLVAAEMYRRHGRHREAADLLRDLAQANPKQAANWHNLAAELYLAEAYAEAAEACAKALELEPGHADARILQAVSSYLAGDRAAAARLLAGLPDGVPPDRVLCLRLLSERTREGADAAEVEKAFAARHDALADGPLKVLVALLLKKTALAEALKLCTAPQDQCRAHCYAGYRAMLDGDAKSAAEQFTKAMEVAPSPHQLERRMAAAELAKLRSP